MVDYISAIKRPFSDFRNLIIGILLGIIPIVNLFVSGYVLTAGNLSLKKKLGLPEWVDWGNLFIRGLCSIFISIIYLIPALAVFSAAAAIFIAKVSYLFDIAGVVDASGLTPEIIREVVKLIPVPLSAAFAVLFILAVYVMPSAWLKYAKDWKIREAFRIKEVFRRAFSAKYFLTSVFTGIYSAIISVLLSMIFYSATGFLEMLSSSIYSMTAGITSITAFAMVFCEDKKTEKSTVKHVVKKAKKRK
ncbi:MAG: DUF4013 domain-containing protein [Candidatus Woesearchaeota archaeon]|nr:DUF4013 domain-containing protein [Candidatus Woesearchaeota archaeon]